MFDFTIHQSDALGHIAVLRSDEVEYHVSSGKDATMLVTMTFVHTKYGFFDQAATRSVQYMDLPFCDMDSFDEVHRTWEYTKFDKCL